MFKNVQLNLPRKTFKYSKMETNIDTMRWRNKEVCFAETKRFVCVCFSSSFFCLCSLLAHRWMIWRTSTEQSASSLRSKHDRCWWTLTQRDKHTPRIPLCCPLQCRFYLSFPPHKPCCSPWSAGTSVSWLPKCSIRCECSKVDFIAEWLF